MALTYTFTIHELDNSIVCKKVTFAKSTERTLDTLKTRLSVPPTKDYYLTHITNEGQKPIQTDKDVELLPVDAKLAIRRQLTKDEKQLEERELQESIKKVHKKQEKASERQELQKELEKNWLVGFQGGKITFNEADEEWDYVSSNNNVEHSATVSSKETIDGLPIVYTWNGEIFLPEDGHKSFGGGKWDGKKLEWFSRFHDVLKVGTTVAPVISFDWIEDSKKFRPGVKGDFVLRAWCWQEPHLRTPKSSKEWKVDGAVPVPVVMLLQILRYIRFGKQRKGNMEREKSISTPVLPESRVESNGGIKPFAKNGYFMLRAQGKAWKKKYLSLPEHGQQLFVYNNFEDIQKKVQPETILLTSYSCSTTMKKEKYCVVLKAKDNSYQLLVETRADRDSWVAAFVSHGATKGASRKEGYLKSRLRYWFVLQPHCLQYFADRKDASNGKAPRGEIDLVSCVVRETEMGGSLGRKNKYGFVLYQPNGKKYFLFTDSLNDMKEWIEAIRACAESLKRKIQRSNTSKLLLVSPLNVEPVKRASLEEMEEEDPLESTDYPFDEDDSPDNIIFVDAEEEKLRPEDPPQIKAATLPKLVERVTYDEYPDTNFLEDFVLTFRSFTTPHELLNLLIKRFNMPSPKKSMTKAELTTFESRRNIVRLRVSNLIRLWIDKQWKDFEEDRDLYDRIVSFSEKRMIKLLPQPTETILKLLKNKMEGKSAPIEKTGKECPTPILPTTSHKSIFRTDTELSLMDFDPEELARQITLIDFEYFVQVQPSDFFNKAWTRKDKEQSAPNLLNMIKRFNDLSSWCATEIVSTENLRNRISVLNRWIEVGKRCAALNNLNAVMAIVSALQSTGIHRLQQTWNGLNSQQRGQFEELKKTVSREANFRHYRRRIKDCSPPCIPYIGVCLTDLTFIEDGSPHVIDGLINFSKRRRIARVLRDILQYQQTPYALQPVPYIQDFIYKGIGLEDAECFTLSIHLEPRTGGTFSESTRKESERAQELVASLRIRRHRRKTSFGRSSVESSLSSLPRGDDNTRGEESTRHREIKEIQTKFYTAVTAGDLDKVKSLLHQGVSLKDNRESHGQTPLHVAAYEGHAELISFFLMLRDDRIGNPELDARDRAGWTALHCAASPGHLDICELLLKFGANPTVTNNEKNLPLHYLARRNPEVRKKAKQKVPLEESLYARVIRQMLEKGADINSQNMVGDTPLHQAAAAANEDGIRLLLKMKAKVTIRNNSNETPATIAENLGHKKAFQILSVAEEEHRKKKEKRSLITNSNIKSLDDIYSIVKLMKDPEHGVTVKDRKHLLISYRQCFIGEEAVDWMLNSLPIHKRGDAVQLGQRMIDSQFIVSLSRNKPFRDNKSFYAFSAAQDTKNFHQMKAKIASLREDPHVVSAEDFDLLKILGGGEYGKVVLARKKDSGKLFAIKVMDKAVLNEEDEYNSLLTEKKILQNDSTFLVHLHYSLQTPSHLFLVMDFIPGGDLGTHLQREERFSEKKTQFVAAELVLALEYLHSRGVVYRDLRPENILLDRDGHICLTDFGFSKIITNETDMLHTARGNPAYSAPELLEGQPYTRSVEWWSLGVVIYQMLLGFTPFEFEDQDLGKLIRNILSSRILYPEELVSHNARSLLESFLERNPKQRLDEIDEIKNRPFFHGIDWVDLSLRKVPSPFKIELKKDDDVFYFDWNYTSQEIEPDEFSKIPSDSYSSFSQFTMNK